MIYLIENKTYLKLLVQYDDFSDMFRSSKSVVCQADSIRDIIKNEIAVTAIRCAEILNILEFKECEDLLIADSYLIKLKESKECSLEWRI